MMGNRQLFKFGHHLFKFNGWGFEYVISKNAPTHPERPDRGLEAIMASGTNLLRNGDSLEWPIRVDSGEIGREETSGRGLAQSSPRKNLIRTLAVFLVAGLLGLVALTASNIAGLRAGREVELWSRRRLGVPELSTHSSRTRNLKHNSKTKSKSKSKTKDKTSKDDGDSVSSSSSSWGPAGTSEEDEDEEEEEEEAL